MTVDKLLVDYIMSLMDSILVLHVHKSAQEWTK